MQLKNVAHVPGLSHHLLSLRLIADAGNSYVGTPEGIRVDFTKSGDTLFAPSLGQLNGLYAHRSDQACSDDYACAVLAPGVLPSPQVVNINDFHRSYGHAHEDLLRKTAKANGVQLQGQLEPCQGCSEAK